MADSVLKILEKRAKLNAHSLGNSEKSATDSSTFNNAKKASKMTHGSKSVTAANAKSPNANSNLGKSHQLGDAGNSQLANSSKTSKGLNLDAGNAIEKANNASLNDALRTGIERASTEIAKVFNHLASHNFVIPPQLSVDLQSQYKTAAAKVESELSTVISELQNLGISALHNIIYDLKNVIKEIHSLAETFHVNHLIRLLTLIAAPLELISTFDYRTFSIDNVNAYNASGSTPEAALHNINALLRDNKSGLILDIDSVQRFNQISQSFTHGNPAEVAHYNYFMPLPINDVVIHELRKLHVSPEIIAALGNFIYHNEVKNYNDFDYIDDTNICEVEVNRLSKLLPYQQKVLNEMTSFIKAFCATGNEEWAKIVTRYDINDAGHVVEAGSGSLAFHPDIAVKLYIRLFKDTIFSYLFYINPLKAQDKVNKMFESFADKTVDSIYEELLTKMGIQENMRKYHDDLTEWCSEYMPRQVLPELMGVLKAEFVTKVDNSLGNHINQLITEMVWPFNPYGTFIEDRRNRDTIRLDGDFWDAEFWYHMDGVVCYGARGDRTNDTFIIRDKAHIARYGIWDPRDLATQGERHDRNGAFVNYDGRKINRITTILTRPEVIHGLYYDQRTRFLRPVLFDYISHWDIFVSFTRVMGFPGIRNLENRHPMAHILSESQELACMGVGSRPGYHGVDDIDVEHNRRHNYPVMYGLHMLLFRNAEELMYRRYCPTIMPAFKLGLHTDAYMFQPGNTADWGNDWAHMTQAETQAWAYQGDRFQVTDSPFPYLVDWDGYFMYENNINSHYSGEGQNVFTHLMEQMAYWNTNNEVWGFHHSNDAAHYRNLGALSFIWMKTWQDVPGVFFDLYLFKLAIHSSNSWPGLNHINTTQRTAPYTALYEKMNFTLITDHEMKDPIVSTNLAGHYPITVSQNQYIEARNNHSGSIRRTLEARYKDHSLKVGDGVLLMSYDTVNENYNPYYLGGEHIQYFTLMEEGPTGHKSISDSEIMTALKKKRSTVFPLQPDGYIDAHMTNSQETYCIPVRSGGYNVCSPKWGFTNDVVCAAIHERGFVSRYEVANNSRTGLQRYVPRLRITQPRTLIINTKDNCIDYGCRFDRYIGRAYEIYTPSGWFNTHVNFACSFKSKLPTPVNPARHGEGFGSIPSKIFETMANKFDPVNLNSGIRDGMGSFNSLEEPQDVWDHKVSLLECIYARYADITGKNYVGMMTVIEALRDVHTNRLFPYMCLKSGRWGILRGRVTTSMAMAMLQPTNPYPHADLLPVFAPNLHANVSSDSMISLVAPELCMHEWNNQRVANKAMQNYAFYMNALMSAIEDNATAIAALSDFEVEPLDSEKFNKLTFPQRREILHSRYNKMAEGYRALATAISKEYNITVTPSGLSKLLSMERSEFDKLKLEVSNIIKDVKAQLRAEKAQERNAELPVADSEYPITESHNEVHDTNVRLIILERPNTQLNFNGLAGGYYLLASADDKINARSVSNIGHYKNYKYDNGITKRQFSLNSVITIRLDYMHEDIVAQYSKYLLQLITQQ